MNFFFEKRELVMFCLWLCFYLKKKGSRGSPIQCILIYSSVKHKDVKAEKDKKNISVMSAAPVFGHFLFRFCLHCLLSLFLFFVVGLIRTGVPYNTLGRKKGIKKKEKTNVNMFFFASIWTTRSAYKCNVHFRMSIIPILDANCNLYARQEQLLFDLQNSHLLQQKQQHHQQDRGISHLPIN